MAYRVEIARQAQSDALEAADHIAQDSPVAAAKWFAGLESAISSLNESPERFSAIPESPRLAHIYRSFHHYSHRVVYRVDEKTSTVFVVRVYHRARKPLAQSNLRE